jgi:hypothetical protein
MLNNSHGELFKEMVFPRNLETDFELIEEFPDAKILHCFRVKDRRRGGAEAVVRLLPEWFAWEQFFVDRFHSLLQDLAIFRIGRLYPPFIQLMRQSGKAYMSWKNTFPGLI